LIDDDTPGDARTRTGWDGEEYVLVFSDESNADGRSFYPGDDPYWEAVDLGYWATKDLELYDPGQVTTALRIKMENKESHRLPYRSGITTYTNISTARIPFFLNLTPAFTCHSP
jgi:beta-glucan synthesis-associated protein KRE6